MIAIVSFFALLALGSVCAWLGCLVPFAAIAAAAAVYVRPRPGMLLLAAVWLLDQALGFALYHYPHAAPTYAWGVAMGVAAFAGYAAAYALRNRPLRAFLAAFGAFEAVLVLFSVALGGWSAYAPGVLLEVFAFNAAWFALAYLIARPFDVVDFNAPR